MALRYLLARGSALSYVSRLALIGLILSVAVLVVVVSVVNGFERELRERVLGVLPHMSIQSYGGLTTHQVDQFEAGGPYPGIAAVAPYVSGTALLSANGNIEGATITGIAPESYQHVTDIAAFTQLKSLESLYATRYGMILGAGLAKKLGVKVGDQVLLVLPVGAITPAGAVPRQRRFEVIDLFHSQSQLDSQTAYIELSAAQRLLRTGNRIHGVQARLTDLFNIEAPRQILRTGFAQSQVRVRSWMSTHGNLYQAIVVQKMTMFVLLSFLVAVAAFNLISGLMMIVEQRKHDIAVLRTMGAQSRSIMWLFALLGLLLAGSGIALGLILGIAFAYGVPAFYELVSNTFEMNLMTQYFIAYLPVDVRISDLIQISAAALSLALLATLYPAWRASRLLPSRVLAHE